ncbi:MAG: CheR family methyltransferase [bacterium]
MDFTKFKNSAIKILNIDLDSYKSKRVERRTLSLMRRHDIETYEDCLDKIENDLNFRAAYLNHFTINTSEFFRNPKSFDYLKEIILPSLFKGKNKIKIWSAPCSNGSEPYTIAIILSEMGIEARRFQIEACDIDDEILKSAQRGQYGNVSIKNVSPLLMKKYFTVISERQTSTLYQLNQDILDVVSFEKRDLINEGYPNGWDLILSRNFFIYLKKDIKDKLIRRFVSTLNEGGYLFLGNTEFIFNPSDFGLEKIHSSFYKKI